MWNTETNRLGDRWMTQKDLVNFYWLDLLSAAIDQFLHAASQPETTILV